MSRVPTSPKQAWFRDYEVAMVWRALSKVYTNSYFRYWRVRARWACSLHSEHPWVIVRLPQIKAAKQFIRQNGGEYYASFKWRRLWRILRPSLHQHGRLSFWLRRRLQLPKHLRSALSSTKNLRFRTNWGQRHWWFRILLGLLRRLVRKVGRNRLDLRDDQSWF